MTAAVYLNGEKLAEHKGGYSTFRVDLTDHLKEENLLAISVDNRDNDTVYPQKADFTFYGGIYRDVTLHIVPAEHFALPAHGAPALKVTPIVTDLAAKTAEVTVEAAVVGAQNVTFALEGQTLTTPVEKGTAKVVFTLDNAHLWDGVDDPFLYTVSAKLDNGEETSARFGCRKFEIDPQKGFILNGREYPLRGVSRHQDRKGAGIALTNEMMEEDIALILEIGANTIRLAHYQHAQYFYDLCDKKGLVIWAEIPYITMHMTNGRANTLTQMEELIVQNYNHPCIAVWGLSNEITAASAVNEDLLENHRLLNELAHKLDPTRKTTMANVFMLETTSPILEIPDVNSYNLYFGWYLGELEQNDEFFDKYHADYPDRCIGFSEYGADANPQYQSSHPEKGDTLEANTQYAVNEAPWSALSSAESSFAEYGDAAIVVFSRSGGEGADLPSGTNGTNDSWISGSEGSGNYLELSAEEIELLKNLKALKDNGTFKSIVVLINSSNALEMDFLNPCHLRRGLRHRCRHVDRRCGPDRYQRCGPAARRHCDPLRLSGGHLPVRQSGKPCHVQLLHPGLPQRSRV